MEFLEISQEQFAAFAAEETTSFLQTPQMADVLAKRGYRLNFLAVTINDKIKMAALITSISVSGGAKLEINFGPIGNFDQVIFNYFIQELKKYAKNHQALEVKVRPDINYMVFDSKGQALEEANESFISEMKKLGLTYNGRHVGYEEQDAVAEWQYIKDLSEITDETSLLKSYNSNAKRNVKKAIKNEVVVRPATYDELAEVERLIGNTGEKRHFATKDLDYYQELYTAFGDNIEFLLTFQGETAIAAGVFIEVNREFLYLYGGSDGAYGKLGGPFLMQHTAMLHALERQLVTYNFYGISGKFDGSDGVLKFKQNFGGYITQKVGEFSYYPQPIKYKIIQGIKKLLGRA
ncbi:peptidoglycan bridge formation glycyltransferase FemA/FemB family protein [Lactococcus ileimucosae]|uniref:Peptidoglycan bridge formation glycyltransferase FemA/FemB family protein n=1 Tax=Lactococcus ileimucosae TaxID=2941329 RepID=A0ABV4D0S8_9LACT